MPSSQLTQEALGGPLPTFPHLDLSSSASSSWPLSVLGGGGWGGGPKTSGGFGVK